MYYSHYNSLLQPEYIYTIYNCIVILLCTRYFFIESFRPFLISFFNVNSYNYSLRAASCKKSIRKNNSIRKISQQENTYLGLKYVFLLTYFFLLTFYMKRPLVFNIKYFFGFWRSVSPARVGGGVRSNEMNVI